MPNKKEPLSIIAIKTLLAVIIFTGVGTIIVGGGWLIGNNYENKTDDKIVKPVDQEMRKCVKEGEKFYLKPGEPQTKECCHGLKTGTFYSIVNGKCIPESIASICIDCPSGKCGLGENKCNCPEDCREQIDTADWKTYRNEKYGYSFKYPQDSSISSNQFATDEHEAFNIALRNNKSVFNVEVQDPKMFENVATVVQTMNLELKEFTEKIWKLNKEDINPNIKNKKVGKILQTTIDGKIAYQFALTESYHDERGGYTLDRRHFYFFTENNGLNFMIWFPADDQVAQQILSTFKFTEK